MIRSKGGSAVQQNIEIAVFSTHRNGMINKVFTYGPRNRLQS